MNLRRKVLHFLSCLQKLILQTDIFTAQFSAPTYIIYLIEVCVPTLLGRKIMSLLSKRNFECIFKKIYISLEKLYNKINFRRQYFKKEEKKNRQIRRFSNILRQIIKKKSFLFVTSFFS